MYEGVQELWKEYLAKHGSSWRKSDPRQGLSAEVTRRLEQLNLILEKLKQALTPSPEEEKRRKEETELFLKMQKLFARGDITKEDFEAGLSQKSPEETEAFIQRTKDVWLFTETFYGIAWRLREILNVRKPSFPNLQKIVGLGIRNVRNLLIEHPEDQKGKGNYEQTMIVTNDGPVLKSLEVRIDGQTGQSSSAKDSVDRGLYINAQEFKDEMERAITKAIN
jgi:hypothetical protein